MNTIQRLAKAAGKRYGGEIRQWKKINWFGSARITGILYSDEVDKLPILTSEIVWIESDFDYVETLNSFYALK